MRKSSTMIFRPCSPCVGSFRETNKYVLVVVYVTINIVLLCRLQFFSLKCCTRCIRQEFRHVHFIPTSGVGKRGAYYLVHGDLPPVWVYLQVYWPCAGGLSAVNAIGTQLRHPINSGLTPSGVWRFEINKWALGLPSGLLALCRRTLGSERHLYAVA